MRRAYPPEQSYMLWCMSWAGLCVGVFGLLRGYFLLGALHTLVGITALSYWSDPDLESWRRLADISAVQLAMWSTIYSIRARECRFTVYLWMAVGAMAYAMGWQLDAYPWPSAVSHGILHLCANLANLTVYVTD